MKESIPIVIARIEVILRRRQANPSQSISPNVWPRAQISSPYFVLLGFLALNLLLNSAQAACTGSGQSWNCTAGTTSAELQSAVNSAADGATLTFAAGSYTWNSWVSFSNSKGVTLICASVRACTVTVAAGTILGMNGNLSGLNTKLYRISGFVFKNAPAYYTIWFDGTGTMTSIRIDHNTFQDFATGGTCVMFGDVASVAAYYGVIDNNIVTGPNSVHLTHYVGATNPNPPPSPKGTANNMFVENNVLNFPTVTDVNASCNDSWGGATYVWRYNTSTNCRITTHGAVHWGGPFNFEVYGNNINSNTSAGGLADGYRLFHHQGSNEFIAFNNIFSAPNGKNGAALDMTHYRSADPASAGYTASMGRCDGTSSIDGNRTPASTYFGYPCWRQPGRDGLGNLQPMYIWNNRWADNGAKVDMNVSNPWGTTNPSVADHVKANRDYYNAVSASAQTSTSIPFNGTAGMGFGTLANRPASCATNPLETGGGVGYFATDVGSQGTLYRCSAANTWTVHYVPYTYPHPLTLGPQPIALAPAKPRALALQ